MKLPSAVIILGKRYTIEYKDNPAEVDLYKRESLWGQIDYWTRSIRVYKHETTSEEDVWHSLIHEVFHGIAVALKLKAFKDNANHDDLDLLALTLTDVLIRNQWLQIEDKQHE